MVRVYALFIGLATLFSSRENAIAQQFLEDIKHEHPRIILTSEHLDNLRDWQTTDTLLMELLKAAAAFPDWGPEHYLNIGEISDVCGIGYD